MSAIPSPEEWMAFLKKYAAANSLDKWPGKPGAAEEQLVAVEERLKIKLPPSYRAFLKASNGLKFDSDMTPVIRPVEKVRWFRKEHREWYEAYQMGAEPICVLEKDYFDYAKQDCVIFEFKHFAQTLCISEIGDDALILLNPMVIWPDGEWETWFFSNSSPGATRYPSFAAWMAHELDQSFGTTSNPGELPAVYRDPPGKENRRIRPRQKVPALQDVLKKLKSEKEEVRVRAADQLAWLGGKQAIDALIEALKDPVPRVRWGAADSLGVLRPPEALEALIAAATEEPEDPAKAIAALAGSKEPGAPFLLKLMERGGFGANVNAVRALGSYNDERSAQVLLKILERCGYGASPAGYALAKRGDVRAIKPMLESLFSKDDSRATWHHLTEFEGAGFEVLEPLMTHADVEIRKRAEACISSLAHHAKDRVVRRKAFELLQQCLLTEVDQELRNSIRISVEISAKKNRK